MEQIENEIYGDQYEIMAGFSADERRIFRQLNGLYFDWREVR